MAFNLASTAFDPGFFTLPIGDHTLKITGFKVIKKKQKNGLIAKLVVSTRVVDGNAETNNKLVMINCDLGEVDESTGDLPVDDHGEPIADKSMIAQITFAALGYEQNEVRRFESERAGIDLELDVKEEKVIGDAFNLLKGCSIRTTVTHNQVEDRTYARYNNIRPAK